MQEFSGNLIETLSRLAFPKIGIIDIIQIALIAFFCISVHGMDQIYSCIYTSERNTGRSPLHSDRVYFQDEYDSVDFFKSGKYTDRRCDRYFSAGAQKSSGTAWTKADHGFTDTF